MKKIIALVLALVMALSFAACGETASTPAESGNGTPAPAASGNAPAETNVTSPAEPNPASPAEPTGAEPAANGGWPAEILAGYAEGKIEFPVFTGACAGFDVNDSGSGVSVTCLDAETADVRAYVEGLESVGFVNRLFWLSDTVYLKASYAADMITIARKDEAGKWPYNQILADLGYAADDLYGVSAYTFAYDKASHTVTCANADKDLYDNVVGSFNNGNWDSTDKENVFTLYKRSDDYPNILAAITLNGSTLTVVFTVS